jgi:pyruvate/2-oxoglutarate dehydrogenase complex dihydrolipoamide dehydrogenase (E3) component
VVRASTEATLDRINAYAPDFIVVATGAKRRPCPFDISDLDSKVRVIHAWDALLEPGAISASAKVTIIGGGIVGLETADLLTLNGTQCTVLEALAAVAPTMARNNRMELLDRLRERGAQIFTHAKVEKAAATTIEFVGSDGLRDTIDIGDYLIIAIGPLPDRDVVPIVERSGVNHALVGDCSQPGDFLSCLRDAGMVALSIEQRL